MEKMVNVDALRRDGIAPVHPPLSLTQATEIELHLCASPCYLGHVKVYGDGVPRSWDDVAAQFDIWCHDMPTVVTAPHIWDLAVDLLPTAASYLGSPPRLYSLNAFWTRPSGSEPARDLQTWHRDHDDERFVALFVYGTDVLEHNAGAHYFQMGTHDGKPEGETRAVLGPAGTCFLADTRGLHMGAKPFAPHGPRLLIWARYCVSDRPWSYDQDRLSPVPAGLLGDRYPKDPEIQEMVRLVAS